MHDGVASELTDGFAFGVTVLMALTGLPATGIKQRCRHMLKWPTQPQRWQPPGVPDVAAGSWDGGASSGLAEIIQGLDERWEEDRMPLPDVLARLEAMVVAATEEAADSLAGRLDLIALDPATVLAHDDHAARSLKPLGQPVRLPLSQRLTGQVANGDLARACYVIFADPDLCPERDAPARRVRRGGLLSLKKLRKT